MAEVIDVDARLDRLTATVASVRAERQAAKAAAWDRLKTDHPESAAVIAEFGRVFGRLERVIVRQENRTVFDSKTWRPT